MADDWKPGDLALCVCSDGWEDDETGLDAEGPQCGAVVTVRRVGLWGGIWMLWLQEWPGEQLASGYYAVGFRKIHPLTDKERETALRELNAPARENV